MADARSDSLHAADWIAKSGIKTLASWPGKVTFGLIAAIQTCASLGRLSDANLRDIGLTRNDVEAATHLGASRDASEILARKARLRAGNW